MNPEKMGVGFGHTEEFFHVTFKLPSLCPKNDIVNEDIKRLAVDFGQTEKFFHVIQKIPNLCPKNDRVSELRKNGRRFWTD